MPNLFTNASRYPVAIVSHPSLPITRPPCPRAPVVPLTRYLLPTRYFAVYYPTPDPIIERMLRLANVSAKDTVYDLGCGDGRGEAAGRAFMIGGG